MSKKILQKDIIPLLGIDALPQKDQETFLEDIGALVLENALHRLVRDMDAATKKEFERLVDVAANPDALFTTLAEQYPAFDTLLEEEVVAFKREAIAVMGSVTH